MAGAGAKQCPSAAASKGGRGDARFRSQFRKTELCVFFMRGWCSKDVNCLFAHGEHELQVAPDLTKTSLCKKFQRNACPLRGEDCPFAHGARELRKTAAYAAKGRGEREAPRQPEHLAELEPASAFVLPSAAAAAPTPLALAMMQPPVQQLPSMPMVRFELLATSPGGRTVTPGAVVAASAHQQLGMPVAAPVLVLRTQPAAPKAEALSPTASDETTTPKTCRTDSADSPTSCASPFGKAKLAWADITDDETIDFAGLFTALAAGDEPASSQRKAALEQILTSAMPEAYEE